MAGIYQPITAIDDSDSTIKGDAMLIFALAFAAQDLFTDAIPSPSSASSVVRLQTSLRTWRNCIRSAWHTASGSDVDSIMSTSFMSCVFEQELYRGAVIEFARVDGHLNETDLSTVGDRMVSDNRARLRTELGLTIASDLAIRAAIRQYGGSRAQRRR